MKQTVAVLLFLLLIFVGSCRQRPEADTPLRDLPEIVKSDTLRVLTLYGSTSYFLYRNQEMGYEYELIGDFAKSLGLEIKMIVAENEKRLVEMLEEGEGDVIAYNLPVNHSLKNKIDFCGQEMITHQVLVQRIFRGQDRITDVTQLVGKEVYVNEGSKYHARLRHLNDELGGGIKIHTMSKDTLTTEDIIGMVAQGNLPYTLADDNIALLNKTYHNNLDVNLEVSFPQRSSWAVSKESPLLATAINDWFKDSKNTVIYKSILKRYFENSKQLPLAKVLSVKNGQISVFDHLFKRYAPEVGWDWRLIASQAFQESQFDTTAVSWAGAQGLMQLMPPTARRFGLTEQNIKNPEANLKAAIEVLKTLNRSFGKIEDPAERTKFILAAYNSGIGHVYDAMALAEKHGKNPDVWDKNVAEYILLKSNPEFFNDPVCRFGYFRGRETVNYVNDVIRHFNYYKNAIH